MASDEVVAVREASFGQEVLQSAVPVLVDFWAPWCGPCRTVAPLLDELVAERRGALRVVKVNVDENPVLANQFRVSSIPTFILFKNGQVADRILGAMPKAAFQQFLERNLGAPQPPASGGPAAR
jgi:thioredoxin 1